MEHGAHRLSVLLFTDIVSSVQMQERMGTRIYARQLERHDALFREAMAGTTGRILKHTGDGFLAEFQMSSEAVRAAVQFQFLLHRETWEYEPMLTRVGLHQGEVMVVESADGSASPQAVGMAVNLAARVMDLGSANQILITRPVYENARYYLKEHEGADGMRLPLAWKTHGPYLFKGTEEEVDIYEVGLEEIAPLVAPAGGQKSRLASRHRQDAALLEETLSVEAVNDSDAFISYAWLDNAPLAEGEPGWVTRFHRTFETRLSQLLGRPASVWRDPKPVKKDAWREDLAKRIPCVATMIPVISPPFAKAEACEREIEAFIKSEEPFQDRLFQVVKSPVNLAELKPSARSLFQTSPRFEFYERNDAGHLIEFDDSLGEDSRRRFLHRVYDLAYEVSAAIKGPADSDVAQPSSRKAVFLAETTHDLTEQRDQIRRELLERGYQVLPDRPLPHVATELEKAVCDYLDKADVAIHLVGSRYGLVPEGTKDSAVEMQCRLTATGSEQKTLARFIWAPGLLTFDDGRQEAFLTRIQNGQLSTDHTEFLRGSIEELKRLVLSRLSTPVVDDAIEEIVLPNKVLYLICDPQDETAIEPVEDYLYELGYEVKVPPFDGDPTMATQVHRQTLTVCDGVLVYFGAGSTQWAEMNLMDLMKAPAYGRKHPIEAQGVIVAPPFNRRKDRLRTRNATVMRQEGSFDVKILQPFLDQVGSPSNAHV